MKKLALSLIVFITLFGSFAPVTYAAGLSLTDPIIPEECNCKEVTSPNTGQKVPSAPDWGCVMQVVQNSINFAITLGMLIAILYIVWTGFLFVASAGNPSQREAAKTRIMNVVVGMLVVLAAWLVIDFVMKSLYNPNAQTEDGSVKFGFWNTILSADGKPHCIAVAKRPEKLPDVIGQAPPGADVTPGGAVPNDPGVVSEGEVTHAEGVAKLNAAGVEVKPGASVNGTREDTIDQVIAVKKACGCAVTVTSGTDGSHASGTYSHANGYKIDLRITSELDAFLKSLTPGGTRSNGDPRYYDRCGNEYVREGDHWDITVNKGVCDPPKK